MVLPRPPAVASLLVLLGVHVSNTQVSFVPPPWLELTTSEPFLSATRVRPPGTIRTRSRPVSTNGRRSTWRGATPSSTQVGQVDSASVGWATKFFGLDLSLARNVASVALSAIGPINMPYPPEPCTSLTTSSPRLSSTYVRCSASRQRQVGTLRRIGSSPK